MKPHRSAVSEHTRQQPRADLRADHGTGGEDQRGIHATEPCTA